MTKTWIFAAVMLVGCGGEEPSIFDEGFDGGTEEPVAPIDTSAEDSVSESAVEETSSDAPASDTSMTDAPIVDSTDAPADGGAGIKCGTATCDGATQVCCHTTATGMQACIATTAACAGGKVACSSPASCPGGQDCCLGTAGLISGATCKTSCGLTEGELCASDTDCTMPLTCKNLSGSGGLKSCQ